MNKLELAESAEKVLNEMGYGYDAKSAVLFAIVTSPNGVISLSEVTRHGDVYELLKAKDAVSALAENDAVLLATCGWAAPVAEDEDGDELAPSQHPKRRRVRLAVSVSDKGVASVLRFQDEPEDTVTDDGNASGSLADAVMSLRSKARKKKNKK